MPNIYNVGFIRFFNICEQIRTIIKDNTDYINSGVHAFHTNDYMAEPIIGDYRMVANYPCVAIEPPSFSIDPVGANYTTDIKSTILVECLIKSSVKEMELKYLCFFAGAIASVLLPAQHNRMVIDNRADKRPTSVESADNRYIWNFHAFGTYNIKVREGNVRSLVMPITAIEQISSPRIGG